MILWMSAEVYAELADDLAILRNSIVKQINEHLKEIEYENEDLKCWDIIITLRNDDVFKEIIKYRKKKKDTDFHLKMDYVAFKNGDTQQRRNLIYDMLVRSLDILEEKGITDLEPVREIINKSRDENIDEYLVYYKSIRVIG
jgi:hypothetical protein